MRNKLAFVTVKKFNDDTEKIVIKNGYLPNNQKAQKAKRKKKLQKEREYKDIFKDGQQLALDTIDTQNKEINEKLKDWERKYSPTIENAVRSMNRAKDTLMDILRSNEFSYFVTLTFDKTKVDRLNDTETRKAVHKWRDNIRKTFPDMTYVAVPEYHEKGGLHYHILVGNITADQLGLIDSGHKVRKGKTKGQPIFNVTTWKYGFSTATQVLDTKAVKYYISKYLTKGKLDSRFFGKKRFFTSQNINRPTVEKYQIPLKIGGYDVDQGKFLESDFDIYDSIDKSLYNLDYADPKKEYTVLTSKTIDDIF